jgi:anti-sigma-K factor RskA
MSNFLIDEDTDLLAAEFVLGTLDSEERANAQSSLRTDHGFIAMVRIWERRFGELHLMVEPVEPDAKIFQRIKAKIVEIAPREPIPEGKPPLGMTPNPEPPVEATASPATAEMPTPAEPATAGEAASPPALAADGEPPKPAEPLATGEVPAPDAAAAASESVAAIVPGPEAAPAEAAAKSENGATAKAEGPVTPPITPSPLVEPAEQRLDLKAADQRQETRSEIRSETRSEPLGDRPDRGQETTTRGLIRSRRRWRALGLAMTILVVGLAALLAAWRFTPGSLPARLRPAQVMMSLGIEPASKPTPAPRPAPPESQFDE